jgi:peroxiredoxin
MKGCPVRSARAALVFAAALALVLGCCANKKEEAKQASARDAETTPNVTITNFASIPDVELKGLDGSVVRFSSFRGKIVFLAILAAWNKESERQVSVLNELGNSMPRGYVLIGVFTDRDGKTAVQTFVRQNPVRFPAYYNGEEVVARLGGVRRHPTTYVVLRDGSIYTRETGFRSKADFNRIIKQLRGQRF